MESGEQRRREAEEAERDIGADRNTSFCWKTRTKRFLEATLPRQWKKTGSVFRDLSRWQESCCCTGKHTDSPSPLERMRCGDPASMEDGKRSGMSSKGCCAKKASPDCRIVWVMNPAMARFVKRPQSLISHGVKIGAIHERTKSFLKFRN